VPTVSVDHVHAPRVSVREQMAIVRTRLQRSGSATFRSLVSDCTTTLEVVGRFLALLELYREGVLAFDQASALAELRVRWTAADDGGEAGFPDDEAVDEEYG
jgi:segregation and condensation protein A